VAFCKVCTLSVICGRLTVVCMGYVNCVIPFMHICGCLQSVYSVSYLRKVGGFVHGVCEFCQLLESGLLFSTLGLYSSN
jgi:hypothetical protein